MCAIVNSEVLTIEIDVVGPLVAAGIALVVVHGDTGRELAELVIESEPVSVAFFRWINGGARVEEVGRADCEEVV